MAAPTPAPTSGPVRYSSDSIKSNRSDSREDFESKHHNNKSSSSPSDDDEGGGRGEEARGVSKVEVFNKILYRSGRKGQILLWSLAISIGLTMFVYALDQGITTTFFTAIATSTLGVHENTGAVAAASQIIRAISKPFIGKLSDITSRPTTYVIVLVFYVVGFIVAASASGFPSYTIGICFTAVGKSGLDLLGDIIVGDLTPLEWRGFFGALLSVPFVITTPINGFIVSGFKDNWRWGMGMFAIMIPVLLAPAIATLYTMQYRGQKLNIVTMADSKDVRTGNNSQESWLSRFWKGMIEIDIFGLILLGFAFSLILLPFNLASGAQGGWSNPSMIAMLVIGFFLIIVFAIYERYFSPAPLMTKRILKNRAFLAAVTIDVFNQMSSAVRNTYFSSYIYVIKEWSEYQWVIFVGITTMGLSLIGPFVGLLQRRTHRYKAMMMFGSSAKVIGYGLLINAAGNTMTQDTGRLVASQLIFCLSSFSVIGARVGSQASVPHEDLASIISLLALWSTLGSSVGSAISSAFWTNEMFARMTRELPGVPAATVSKYYKSIKKLHSLPFDDAIRQGSIRAYAQTNGLIAITAVCLSAIPVIATFFMPDFYLGKQQNAVTNRGLDGELVDVPQRETNEVIGQEQGTRKWYHKLRDFWLKET